MTVTCIIIPPLPKGGGGILFYLCPSVHPSVQDIFRRIFLSNCWWQKSDIWSQASSRYTILWVAFLDPSDSYFLFADLVGFYTHWTYIHIFRHIFLSNYWWQKSDIWSQASYRYPILWKEILDPSDSYFLFADFVDFYTHLTYICICTFFVAFFSATIDGRDLIFGHTLYIGISYHGNRFWNHQIPTSCLPTLLIFIHIEHICSFFVVFFSATIDGRNLIFGHKLHIGTPYREKRFWTHQIPTSCLPILLIFIHI
jgi:hypothetical protein